MSDQLDWLNKHFVLLRHKTVQEAIEMEKYKLRPDLVSFVPTSGNPEIFVQNLMLAEKYKEACDFLSYIMHRRAAIWWGYNCLLSLNEELKINPATERDIADIGAPKEMPIPEWAQKPQEEEIQAEEEERKKVLAELTQTKEKLENTLAELQKMIPPEVQAKWDEIYNGVDAEFKKAHGVSMMELVEKAAQKSASSLFEIDPNSPIFQATDQLRTDIEAKRQETVELIKSVLPPKVPEHQMTLRDNAMQAIYRWVAAPDEKNSQAALDIGNECPDQPAGLMAMAAFWSYGNMTPDGNQVVPTPAGLAANGINSALLQAALHQGGTRKYKERCLHYLELGLQVIRGENFWDNSLAEKIAPHETSVESVSSATSQLNEASQAESVSSGYKKWKPNFPQN